MSKQAETASPESDDVVFVERDSAPRQLVGMRGHFKLESWRDAEGHSRQFPCEILKISPHAIKFSAPVVGPVGTWAVAHFELLGKFEGPIIQIVPRALVVRIFGTNQDRLSVANKLAWITDAEKPEARRFPRVVPDKPDSRVSLSNGTVAPCEVIDYSPGSAGVYADLNPSIGSVVKIGQIAGRVVRHFGGGFAVAFVMVQDSHSLEACVLQPTLARHVG